jgi:hypothetical protein
MLAIPLIVKKHLYHKQFLSYWKENSKIEHLL